jgi:hypothetical protein
MIFLENQALPVIFAALQADLFIVRPVYPAKGMPNRV